ncbi:MULTISPECIES: LysR family transcriptional regulator [unclassified Bosea (in: a-proteobacteria)]|uniref:LysR family transcriptional regulator n=1 Tax=unclassified Bosea (in: a-proteobacteria) TaxID=2653178 RepID=UPI0013DFE729|nr:MULTISPECIES: LysR family transcriptional regulator [unclassified Bosea (in: a-proteobacteria)]
MARAARHQDRNPCDFSTENQAVAWLSEHPVIPKLVGSTTLRYFSEVADRGSFRAAAESLRIAASAINRQVSNLETDLGVKLFERARGRAGLQLTEAGRILQFRLRSAINELRIANDEIIALQGLGRGYVTIGFNDVIVNAILPEVIKRFHQAHPNITFGVKVDSTRGLVSRLKDGDIDFAVAYNFSPEAELSYMESISLKMYMIASPDHPLAARASVALSDLSGHNLILPDGSGFIRQVFNIAFGGSNALINQIVQTNSFELIHSLVESGVGISIVTGREQRGAQARLTHVEIDDALLSQNVLACCKLTDRNLSPAATAFAGAVCDALRAFGHREAHSGKAGEGKIGPDP